MFADLGNAFSGHPSGVSVGSTQVSPALGCDAEIADNCSGAFGWEGAIGQRMALGTCDLQPAPRTDARHFPCCMVGAQGYNARLL